jgi:two-component system LytT family response regulator
MRALIVEDSKLDRDALKAMLQRVPGVSVAGEAATMEAARRALKESAADVVFLDIEIGSGNGFDLLADIRGRAVVVFTTVHTGHGGRAFDADAVDYIVKPVAEDRLLRALQRAAKALNSDIRGLERVPVHRSGSERQLIALESVSAVLAEGNYSRVVSGYRAYPDHRRLREWQKLLLDFPFERVDRSTLLRLDHVESVRPHGAGAVVSLRNGADPLELGRTARERLAALTGW